LSVSAKGLSLWVFVMLPVDMFPLDEPLKATQLQALCMNLRIPFTNFDEASQ
jgi:hypothetical protein